MLKKIRFDSLWAKSCIALLLAVGVSWGLLFAWVFWERKMQSLNYQTESFGLRVQSLYDNQQEFVRSNQNPIRENWVPVWPNKKRMMGHHGRGWQQEKRLITRFTYIYLTAEPLVKKSSCNSSLLKLISRNIDEEVQVYVKTIKKEKIDLEVFSRMPPSQRLLIASVALDNGEWLNVTSPVIKVKGPNFSFILIVVGLVSLAVVILALYIIHHALRPLTIVESRAHTLGRNMAVEPLEVKGPRELRQVQSAMNRMQQSIQKSFESRTTLLAALSHDLKTPLTRLRLRVEFMKEGNEKEKYLKNINDMEALLAEIMAFAKLQSGSLEMKDINLSVLVQTIIDDAQDVSLNIKKGQIAENIIVKGETLAIKRAVSNLIENALQYAGDATVSLKKNKDWAYVEIRDYGKDLRNIDLEALWQPFRRGENSRNRKSGGTGLGLASVRMIAENMGGEAVLEKCEPHGLKAIIKLPIYKQKKRKKLDFLS